MNLKNIFFSIIILIILLTSFLAVRENVTNRKVAQSQITAIQHVQISGVIIKVDLALTPQAQEQGLSGRSDLKEDQGMLFVFDKSDKYAFWMKDMNFPIDMIWLDSDLKVVYIEKNAQPSSYPGTFAPSEDAKYVLEVVSGFSENHNLKVGDAAEFLP